MFGMRLLFVISQFYKGGAETSLLNLLKLLDRSQYDIDLLIMNQCPLEDAVSLVPQLPSHIYVFDAWKEEQHLSLFQRIRSKALLTAQEKATDPVAALLFVQGREYDWAFHIGEWWMPCFVATRVNAHRKAVWIHSDLSHADYFQADPFFSFDTYFEKYIFVSKNSMQTSCKKFAFIKDKSCCIYNICDITMIRKRAHIPITEDALTFKTDLPVLLTCANIRREKNHMRQLQAMHILKERGLEFYWVNIGAKADLELVDSLLVSARMWGLEKHFLILGPRENPYQYMTHANAIAVFSDYESWSMVITEAKILGIPVIATRTSGALEQLEDGKTGVFTDFSVGDIADKLEMLLKSKTLQNFIRSNLKNFDNTDKILSSFYDFINKPIENDRGRKVLYVIDDVNYAGGAHIATMHQIKELLKANCNVTVFSGTVPTVKIRNMLSGAQFIGWQQSEENQLFWKRIAACLLDSQFSTEQKKYKLRMTWESKIKKNPKLFDDWVKSNLSKLFSGYDVVCVMSEGSAFRREVGNSSSKRKVQFIHTDYVGWKYASEWTRQITADDEELYKKFDKIVLLSENIRDRFIAIYPSLKEKTVVNQNLMPVDEIRRQARRITPKGALVRFVTVGRIDYFKGFDRIYKALNKLYQEGYQFHWTIVGGGENFEEVKFQFGQSEFADRIKFTGALSNPFPVIREADVFALFSRYEGLPNTIYEAMILGIPAIATNVGGVATQIENGVNGWVVENEEDAIYEGIKHILTHPEEVAHYRENLKSYHYNNSEVLSKTEEILFGSMS